MQHVQNHLGKIELSEEAKNALLEVEKRMTVRNYAKASIENYCRELKFLFAYYQDVSPFLITDQMIITYLHYIIREHGVGRVKCRMVAHACSYYFKHILQCPYYTPKHIYPRKKLTLPEVFRPSEIKYLLKSCRNIREKCIVALLYGTGVRCSEFLHLKIRDIDLEKNRILVRSGKGGRDRFVVFPQSLAELLQVYLEKYEPVKYVFEGKDAGKPMSTTSLRLILRKLSQGKVFGTRVAPKVFRHSFATHLLEQGCSLLAIKQMMGHRLLRTTMVYLHLRTEYKHKMISPLDHENFSHSLRYGMKKYLPS
jgi:site-specific recombinase XerD